MTGLDAPRLVDFCHDLMFDTLPEPVQRMARLLLVDTLGCLIGGLKYPQVQALGTQLSVGDAGHPDDVPFGRLVTWGSAATWLDADSGGSFHPQGHRMPPVPTAHPAPHILPVLLHHAREQSRNDTDLLTAFAAAMEVGLRFGVGTSLRPGFHPHGIHGPVAAAVAHSLLAKLDRRATAHAILLALSQPLAATLAVPMRGGTVRNVWTGLGTFLGAQAAVRAASGMEGSAAVVEELFDSSVCSDLDLDEVQEELGDRWRILDSYVKPYACARWIHPALDSFRQAVDSSGRGWRPGLEADIASVQVTTFAFAAALDAAEVSSDMHARFSLPTCVAALAIHGHLIADTFLPDNLTDSRMGDIASRVSIVEDPDFTASLPAERPATVTITWIDGLTSSASVRNARGNPDQPLSLEEVEEKFNGNVGELLQTSAADLLRGEPLVDGVATTHLAKISQQIDEMRL